MKVLKRIFILAIIALLGFATYFLKTPPKDPEHFVRKRAGLLKLITASKEVARIWSEGEDSREWALVKYQCLKKYNISNSFDESLLRCHPLLMECVQQFLPKAPLYIKHFTYQYPSYLFDLEDPETKEKLTIALSDNCHELYLEQNTYAYGEAPTGKNSDDYQFDNLNRQIYFDQHLVTNSDINEWIKYDTLKQTNGLENVTLGDQLFLPATNLNLTQMQNYCSFKGKNLILAHIIDAASFLTSDQHRSPYYWTKKRVEQKINCDLVFSKECLAEKKYRLNSSGPSWAGLYDSLGGVMEAMRNPIDPESNLKASSFYFEKKSLWHHLGFRAHWDGASHELGNFNFKGIAPSGIENTYQVGFRCMREAGL